MRVDASPSSDPAALSFYLIAAELESSDKSLMTVVCPKGGKNFHWSLEMGTLQRNFAVGDFKPKAQP